MPTTPHRDDCDDTNFDVDDASDDSFPASDPPSYTGAIASSDGLDDDDEDVAADDD